MPETRIIESSYRDPNGFVFEHEGKIFRQVNVSYRENYEKLMGSGLYERLAGTGYLIPHEEAAVEPPAPGAYKIIQPDEVRFISYPYEWCFSQLKDAALLTLKIQKEALKSGMCLKDASAFNIQFRGCEPVMIDTLSFEKYEEGRPWAAYRQFCEHFLAPLALRSGVDSRLGILARAFLEGVPLDIASRLLPLKKKAVLPILMHIILHARSQRKHAAGLAGQGGGRPFGRRAFDALIDSLEGAVNSLDPRKEQTAWSDYASPSHCESYDKESLEAKRKLVAALLERAGSAYVWDIGANTGMFSRVASEAGAFTVSMDSDPAVVEKNYDRCKRAGEERIMPLVSDIADPSPALGWDNRERQSLLKRKLPDTVLALALVHHLAIGRNVPLDMIARLFAGIAKHQIIEFVPKEDKQAIRLLRFREDIFPGYTAGGFEKAFSVFFSIKERLAIPGSLRQIYLMERKAPLDQ